MSGTGAQPVATDPGLLPGRTPLAHLLHALNQPLTGLQCSLELATVYPRPAAEYARTLHEALDLTSRMRLLVEALREISDAQSPCHAEPGGVLLNDLLAAQIEDLLPVADAVQVRLSRGTFSELRVRGNSSLLSKVLFRLLDSALSLARPKSDLLIVGTSEQMSALLRVGWSCGPAPEFSPFSRPELGLLIAQAGWQDAGGGWQQIRTANTQSCELRMPLLAEGARR